MKIRVHEPESFIPETQRFQITVRTEFHVYPMLSDMQISSIGYQVGYSPAVGIVHSLHHLDLLGHFSIPFLRWLCLTLLNHNLLRSLLAIGQKIHHDVSLLVSQRCSHPAVPTDLPCQSPPIPVVACQSSANR